VPQWPKLDGCSSLSVKRVELLPDTLLDRIGSPKGTFVGVVQKDLKGNAKAASYVSRSLRLLGETAYPYPFDDSKPEKDKVDLRELLYEEIYNKDNDPNNDLYYVLKVREPFDKSMGPLYGIKPCKAADAFGYPGGALQLELPNTVENLLKDGYLEKLTPAETVALLGRNHPPYDTIVDYMADKEHYFRPYSASLYSLMDEYYTSQEERNEFRKGLGQAATPASKAPAAKLNIMTHTKYPSDNGSPLSPPGAAGPLSPQFGSPAPVRRMAFPNTPNTPGLTGSAV
jgi:hypothetical protein